MATSQSMTSLHELNEGLASLRTSAIRTLPVFLLGILATVVAAGVALYYILTLSADLREARVALEQSQAALKAANSQLGQVDQALRAAQAKADNPAEAKTIATALSDVTQSKAKISSASESIGDAALKISAPAQKKPVITPPPSPAPEPAPPAPAGRFVTVFTSDGFLSLRAEPSIASTELTRIPNGSTLECGEAVRNEANNWWRPCRDSEGRSGYVSNKYIRPN